MVSLDGLFQEGEEVTRTLWGDRVVEDAESVRELAPDFYDLVTAAIFGGLWGRSRSKLDIKTRSLITIALVTSMNVHSQVRRHIRGALNLGIPKEQIIDTIVHAGIYTGPAKITEALTIARGVFQRELGPA